MAVSFIPQSEKNEDHSHWIPLADLMTGLMMIFLLISISFIFKSGENINEIEQKITQDKKIKSELSKDLKTAFSDNLKVWGGQLEEETLTISFTDPNILFKIGDSQVSQHFKKILDDFIPRYIQILSNPKYKQTISELRIEGHTSSEWLDNSATKHDAYMKNMELSQNRTRNVLTYILKSTHSIETYSRWVKNHATATGLSSSKLVENEDGSENKDKSRRVEFRIITDSDSLLKEIQSTIHNDSQGFSQ